MSDPTLAMVDDEPWNKTPTEQRRSLLAFKTPEPVAIETALSIYERVCRGMQILAKDGNHAEYVYDRSGVSTGPTSCERCDAHCICVMWHEWRWMPIAPSERKYDVVRMFFLCNTCSSKLKGLPLGERWKGKGE